MGSLETSEQNGQMTDKACLADIRTEIFKTQDANGCFSQEQTVAKIRATTEMRTVRSLEMPG